MLSYAYFFCTGVSTTCRSTGLAGSGSTEGVSPAFQVALGPLTKTWRGSNNKRLLHPGADTKDILLQYVQTIRCLRIIDPPGVLLFKVADPIRRYLRYETILYTYRHIFYPS